MPLFCNLSRALVAVALMSALWTLPRPARAVIVYGPQGRNTSAPTGTLSTAGWQYEGQFAGFLGTPISSNAFVTATHIGGTVGQDIIFYTPSGQVNYTTTASYSAPNSDLTVWTISGTFQSSMIAPIWNPGTDGSEVGQNLFVVGRGTARGNPIYLPTQSLPPTTITPRGTVTNTGASQLTGWTWGAFDIQQAWGTATVGSIVTDPHLGPFLAFPFTPTDVNSAILSPGDSGGGVFIESNGVWKLAGINYGVDDPFATSARGPYVDGAYFNTGGLYTPDGNGGASFIPPGDSEPQNSYSTEVGAPQNIAFIDGVLGEIGDAADIVPLPEPTTGLFLALSVTALVRRRRVV